MTADSVKVMIFVSFMTPLLIGVVSYFLKRLVNKMDDKLISIQKNVSTLQLSLTTTTQTVVEIKGKVENVKSRINHEVIARDKRFDRHGEQIIAMGTKITVLETQLKNFKNV